MNAHVCMHDAVLGVRGLSSRQLAERARAHTVLSLLNPHVTKEEGVYACMRIGNALAGRARLASCFGMLGVATRPVRTRHW